jgi:hypothetical protein
MASQSHSTCVAQFVEAAGVGGADVEMGPLVQDLRVLGLHA